MDEKELNDLLNRINSTETANGFGGCEIRSYSPIILAYYFDNDENSHRYLLERDLLGMRVEIKDDSPTVVLEYR